MDFIYNVNFILYYFFKLNQINLTLMFGPHILVYQLHKALLHIIQYHLTNYQILQYPTVMDFNIVEMNPQLPYKHITGIRQKKLVY